MQKFTKTISREITFTSGDSSLGDSTWIVEIGPGGLVFRQKGKRTENCLSLAWKTVIGMALIHGAKNRDVEQLNADAEKLIELTKKRRKNEDRD